MEQLHHGQSVGTLILRGLTEEIRCLFLRWVDEKIIVT